MDYGDHVVIGTYTTTKNAQPCTLILRADHSFHQERTRNGKTETADGEWRRIGEGGLAFSKQFLVMSGQEAGADGTSYGEIRKALGLFPSIALARYHILWYGRTDPSTGREIAGSYAGDEPGVSATLILKADHTFEQSVSQGSFARQAQGTWETGQDGDIQFSRDFLKTSGEPLSAAETASAWDPKGSNLQIEIAVKPSLAQPVLRKRLLSF
jgi:hypothetical protein